VTDFNKALLEKAEQREDKAENSELLECSSDHEGGAGEAESTGEAEKVATKRTPR